MSFKRIAACMLILALALALAACGSGRPEPTLPPLGEKRHGGVGPPLW